MHRIVGALSTTSRGGMYQGLERFASGKEDTYGQDFETVKFLDTIAESKLVFLGEIHSVPQIVKFQSDVMTNMAAKMKQQKPSGTLHVIFEHFTFEMQDILEAYKDGRISFSQMVQHYKEIGTEGHDLEPYKPLLEKAKTQPSIKLHGGFLPRTFARQLMKESESAALKAASKWLHPTVTQLEGTDFHYNVFESMFSGRNIHDGTPPMDRFQGIFKAQLLKDVAMAHKINSLIEDSQEEDKFLVIAGNGHVSHYAGVPERVLAQNPHLINQCCLVTSHELEGRAIHQRDASSVQVLLEELEAGPPGANPADYLYVFQDEESLQQVVKKETQEAYDKVGATAHLQGNTARARAIMTYLGYSESDIRAAGEDSIHNYQGVGNPFRHADIQPGEVVLDVGSGLGVDSFIASHHVGPHGRVIGIDLSEREVEHAQARAHQRGLNAHFCAADMEDIPLPDNSVDVVISNGAFCLAPNKEKAFGELFRVLKPGGRISIYTTTTIASELQPGVQWPLCMQMFIAKDKIGPICKQVGFVDIVVDDSDSKMQYELPQESLHELNPDRQRVHVEDESSDFEHLEDHDMDSLCARVCVVARKPRNDEQATTEIKTSGSAL